MDSRRFKEQSSLSNEFVLNGKLTTYANYLSVKLMLIILNNYFYLFFLELNTNLYKLQLRAVLEERCLNSFIT